MKHTLRDLSVSDFYVIARIDGTDALKPQQWLTWPITHDDDGRLVCGLFVCEEAVEEAAELFPDAIVRGPDNSRLKVAQ